MSHNKYLPHTCTIFLCIYFKSFFLHQPLKNPLWAHSNFMNPKHFTTKSVRALSAHSIQMILNLFISIQDIHFVHTLGAPCFYPSSAFGHSGDRPNLLAIFFLLSLLLQGLHSEGIARMNDLLAEHRAHRVFCINRARKTRNWRRRKGLIKLPKSKVKKLDSFASASTAREWV